MSEEPVTRQEFDRLRELAEAALLITSRIIGEHPFEAPSAGSEDSIHARLARIARAPELLDSSALADAVHHLRRAIPQDL